MKNSTMLPNLWSIKNTGICFAIVFSCSNSFAQSTAPKCTEVIPEFHSVYEKEVWIKDHPNSMLLDDAKKKEIVSNPFPVYISTGSPTKDEADYIRLKNEWIENNPEEYKRMLEKASIPLSNESKKN